MSTYTAIHPRDIRFFPRALRLALVALVLITLLPSQGRAANLTTIANFDGTNGADLEGSLLADADGNLFGTTSEAGANNSGTVFEIQRLCWLRFFRGPCIFYGGYASTPITLVNFNSADGANPTAGLIADANGNLFGTTVQGGTNALGTVFEIVKPAGGWTANLTPTVLESFNGQFGANPRGGLIADAEGNLYGTTTNGGPYGGGTVFEIAKCPANGTSCVPGTYTSGLTILVTFYATHDSSPYGNLLADANGNLFGATMGSGVNGDFGTVFEVVKPSGGWTNNLWPNATVLVSFNGANGSAPVGGLIADAGGNLIGATVAGGANGFGAVFEIARCPRFVIVGACPTGYANTPTVLLSFDQVTNGQNPENGLIADAAGNLFGTASQGGPNGYGTVFEIAKCPRFFAVGLGCIAGYASSPTVLFGFNNSDGYGPNGLIADAFGNLLGSTYVGGPNAGTADGMVFEITGSGYLP